MRDATTITVTAGGVTPDIDFFLAGPDTPPPPPQPAGPTTYDPVARSFAFPIFTETGTTYQLQRSDSRQDGTWHNVGDPLWGQDGAGSLVDPDATGDRSFYRVMKK